MTFLGWIKRYFSMLLSEKKAVSAVTALFPGKVMTYLKFLLIFVLVTTLNYLEKSNWIWTIVFWIFKLKKPLRFFWNDKHSKTQNFFKNRMIEKRYFREKCQFTTFVLWMADGISTPRNTYVYINLILLLSELSFR